MKFSFKPLIILTAATSIAAGCQREKLQDDTDSFDERQTESFVRSFTVLSESRQPQDSTKTYLGGSSSNASRSVLWNKGDCLYVTDGSSGSKFTVTSASGSTKAKIEGSIAYSKWYSSVYPYSIVYSYGKSGFSVNLPSVQTYYPDGVCSGSYPMVALCDGGMFRFKNVCGIFAIQLKGDGGKVSSISFSGRNSAGKEIPVAGAAMLALQSGSDPTLSFYGGASTSVTLDCSGVSSLSSLSSTPITFHIVLPFGTYDSITLGVTLTDGRRMTVNSGRPLTIHRSGFTLAGSLTFKEDAPEAVDLGLPSGLKWASCNLGASKPEEYGGYYQWAGTQDVTSTSIYLDWSNCPYYTGSSSSTGLTKYVPSGKSSYWSGFGSPDNKTVLDPSDDVAHVRLGGKWRMPTLTECNELYTNCTSAWTTLNGVEGRKFTSKKNGNSIFLPAAGYRTSGDLSSAGSGGLYWSSSLYAGFPKNAYYLLFNSGFVGTDGVGTGYDSRCYGQSVRPVYGDRVSVTGVSFSKTSLNLNIGETYTLSATVTPSNAAEQSVSWSSNNSSVASVDASGKVTALNAGTATITVKTTDGGYTAMCKVTVVSAGPEYVDLGLSVKWASCNLGASKPEEYGGYYQWAGTQDVTSTSIYLDWSNCPYHTGSDYKTGWKKYVPSGKSPYWSGSGSPDNKTVLDPSDDVAHVKLGGKWRMPTRTECDELYTNCTSEWTTLNGVKGRKFTSKKNGNSIFLPAAGYRGGGNFYYVGSRGYYWSSSLSTGYPYSAYGLYFDTDNVEMSYDSRCSGQSVRPVSE